MVTAEDPACDRSSVPLHAYFGVVRGNVDFVPRWFSYVLFPFYGALLIMFAPLRYRR
jgi:hypothetical protein